VKRRGVKVVNQRKSWDCGVACLAMLLGKPYGDVAAFARDLIASDLLDVWRLHKRGLVIHDMQLLADGFGVALRPVPRQEGYLDGQTGILGMLGGEMDPAGHWVVLKAGAIVDPDGSEVWSVEDYMARTKSRTVTLLVEG
jgi:ABC-type bacteriocin/lantibiotic exporter with double-glycine peptidase domain